MKAIGRLHLIIAASVVSASLLAPALCSADTFPSLGSAADYAVLGIGGSSVSLTSDFEVYQSATVINGNVGEGPFSLWTHGIDATINGRVDYDTTDSAPTVTGTITGGLHQIPMGSIVTNARNASTAAAILTPTLTLSTLTNGQVIVGAAGLNVIHVTGDVDISGGGTTFTLQGVASSQFVFQLTASDAPSAKTLNLKGVTMTLTGGGTQSNHTRR